MKILIAEDMKVPRVVLEMTLKKMGHEYVTTEDGVQAFQAIERDDFPVVITDWQMPNMDGLELCRRIRTLSRPRYTYIIMLTALDTKPNYMEAIDAGTDDFLNKPLEVDLLTARLCVAQRIGGMLTKMQQLQGMLPICSTCKKVRDGEDNWLRMEEYIGKHSQAAVTASQCPHCHTIRHQTNQHAREAMNNLRQEVRKAP